METTTCIVLCLLIVSWAAVRISDLYFRSKDAEKFSESLFNGKELFNAGKRAGKTI